MEALSIDAMTREQDRQISAMFEQNQSRLRNFIRRRISDPSDVEDVLQEVFFELVEAYRLMRPIEKAGAWLFRVARNRIIDRFRKRSREIAADFGAVPEGSELSLEELLPAPEAGPEVEYVRNVLLEEIADALAELPAEQREVFIAHEVEGQSFDEIAARTGVKLNTLLSRKRYAVLHLRRRLQAIYDEFMKR